MARSMCMVYDYEGNILVQDRLDPGWPGGPFLVVMWSQGSPLLAR